MPSSSLRKRTLNSGSTSWPARDDELREARTASQPSSARKRTGGARNAHSMMVATKAPATGSARIRACNTLASVGSRRQSKLLSASDTGLWVNPLNLNVLVAAGQRCLPTSECGCRLLRGQSRGRIPVVALDQVASFLAEAEALECVLVAHRDDRTGPAPGRLHCQRQGDPARSGPWARRRAVGDGRLQRCRDYAVGREVRRRDDPAPGVFGCPSKHLDIHVDLMFQGCWTARRMRLLSDVVDGDEYKRAWIATKEGI